MGSLLRRYVNQAGFAAQAQIAKQAMVNRVDSGLVPPPDVYVGRVVLAGKAIPGWSQTRITAYLEFVAPYLRQLADGRRLRFPVGLQFPDWWHVDSEWFLNQREVAHSLGLQPVSVSVRVARGTFPVAPKVVIGEKSHGQAHGWEHDEIVEYGQQDTYLDKEGKVADVGRKGPPRKAVNPKFYADRAAARQSQAA